MEDSVEYYKSLCNFWQLRFYLTIQDYKVEFCERFYKNYQGIFENKAEAVFNTEKYHVLLQISDPIKHTKKLSFYQKTDLKKVFEKEL